MSQPPLFRDEARQALKVRLEGEVVAFTPPSLKRLSALTLVVLVLAGAFASTATYTQYVPAGGTIAPREGLVTLGAPFKGDIVRIGVKEGEHVQSGQALALLRTVQVQPDGQTTLDRDRALLSKRQSLTHDLLQAKQAELARAIEAGNIKVAGLSKNVEAAQVALSAAQAQAAASLKYLNQQRDLVKSGFMASAGLVGAERTYLADVQLVRQAEQGVLAQRLELANARQEVVQARGQQGTLNAQSADAQTELEQQAARLNASAEAAISSTVAGTVAAAPALPGPVVPGTPLFVIAPDGPRFAHLYLNERAAQRAKVGQAVTMRVQSPSADDMLRLTGTIATLSVAPVPLGDKGEQGYKALVLLDAPSQKKTVPLGARVEARLQVQTKSLLGWLVDPLSKGLRQAAF